jgi:hypothetical protein
MIDMKPVIVIVGIVATVFGVNYIKQHDVEARAAIAESVEQTDPRLIEAVLTLNTMLYVKDENTGRCFGYIRDSSQYGGIALAHIPCQLAPDTVTFWSNN